MPVADLTLLDHAKVEDRWGSCGTRGREHRTSGNLACCSGGGASEAGQWFFALGPIGERARWSAG